jgi:hypothetical protein
MRVQKRLGWLPPALAPKLGQEGASGGSRYHRAFGATTTALGFNAPNDKLQSTLVPTVETLHWGLSLQYSTYYLPYMGIWRQRLPSSCISECGDEPNNYCGTRLDLVIYQSTRRLIHSTAVIRCTSSGAADNKMISKWARALRYVAECKEHGTRLKAFMKEAGGVNACVTRYAKLKRRSNRRRGP